MHLEAGNGAHTGTSHRPRPVPEGAKDIKTTELKGGITNLNYKIDTGGKSYVLRITGETTDQLGIKRDVEYASNKAAGELGIAPEVCTSSSRKATWSRASSTASVIPPEEMAKPDNIRRVVRKLRLYHTRAPEVKGEFNVFRRVEHLIKISKEHNCKFPFDFDWIMQKMHGGGAGAAARTPTCPRPATAICST